MVSPRGLSMWSFQQDSWDFVCGGSGPLCQLSVYCLSSKFILFACSVKTELGPLNSFPLPALLMLSFISKGTGETLQEEGVLPLGCRPSPVPGPTVYPGQQLIALTQLATAMPSPCRCLDLSGERALPGVLHLNPE